MIPRENVVPERVVPARVPPRVLYRGENFIPVRNLATVSCKRRTTITGRSSVQRDLRKVRKYRNISDHKASNLGVFHLSSDM